MIATWPAFLSDIANHLWQSTLFAVAVSLLTLLFRNNHARIRHSLWLAASLKFLIPFSLLVAAGGSIEFGQHKITPSTSAAVSYIGNITQAFQAADPTGAVPKPADPDRVPLFRFFFYGAWICGTAVVLLFYLKKMRNVRAAVRRAKPLTQGRAFEALECLKTDSPCRLRIRLASSKSSMEPGVFGIFRPVLLLPEGMPERLSDAELDAILAHELAHVRHHDNLSAAIHMLIEALFWFHPMVWWLGARLVQERERACDEEVLRLGKDPQSYAEGILKVCEFYLESPLACVAGVTGSNMKQRIHTIMTNKVGSRLGLAKKVVLASAGTAVLAMPLLIGIVNAPPGRAQSTADSRQSFDVASVKPSRNSGSSTFVIQPGGRVVITGISLRNLMARAYDLHLFQILGGPDWISSSSYDIEAKSNAPVYGIRQINGMLQSLLEERFRLKIHREVRELPVYVLTVPKGGHKLQAARDDEGNPIKDIPRKAGQPMPPPPPGTGSISTGPDGKRRFNLSPGALVMLMGQLEGRAVTLDTLIDSLSMVLGRTIVDKTGLTGLYDISLQWEPGKNQPDPLGITSSADPGSVPSADLSRPSLLTSIRDQLGLKLDSGAHKGEVVVIDSVERPSEN